MLDLDDVRGEQRQVDRQERQRDRQNVRERPIPPTAGHDVEEQRRDRHRAGDGDSVRGAQRVRVLESQDEQDAAEHQQPVDLGNVDLSGFVGRRVHHGDARRIAELHRLLGQREGAGDQRLRRDHRGDRREHDERQQHHPRGEEEERIRRRRRIPQQQRALAEVVQHQRREHEGEPGNPNRPLPEVAHVRVQRFGARDGEDDRAEREEGDVPVRDEERSAMPRVERAENPWLVNDRRDSEHRDRREPHAT